MCAKVDAHASLDFRRQIEDARGSVGNQPPRQRTSLVARGSFDSMLQQGREGASPSSSSRRVALVVPTPPVFPNGEVRCRVVPFV